MSLTSIIFYILSAIGIASALMVLVSKNPVHSVLWLVAVFFTISGHYILLNAQFLAVVNIIVYAGAIMVLFLFVVMLMNLNTDTEPVRSFRMRLIGVISGGSFLLLLLAAFLNIDREQPVLMRSGQEGLISSLGKTLFTHYVIPFEISSLLFLSAIIGAVVISKRDDSAA